MKRIARLKRLARDLMTKTRKYQSLRKRITPELLRKSLDPEFQRNLRADAKVRDYYRLRMERQMVSSFKVRKEEFLREFRTKIRKGYVDRIQEIRFRFGKKTQPRGAVALIEDLAVKKRQEASEQLRGLSESLIQKTKECQQLRWTLRKRVTRLEFVKNEKERTIAGLRGVKYDREMRMKRLIDLRRKMKRRWIEGVMSSEEYVDFLLKVCKPRSDMIELFHYTLEKLRRKALRLRKSSSPILI